jgi:hypothetical protein
MGERLLIFANGLSLRNVSGREKEKLKTKA